MRLSELKELRPDVWEIAKNEAIRLNGKNSWNYYVETDRAISGVFSWRNSRQNHKVWEAIYFKSDFSLMDKWIAGNATT